MFVYRKTAEEEIKENESDRKFKINTIQFNLL